MHIKTVILLANSLFGVINLFNLLITFFIKRFLTFFIFFIKNAFFILGINVFYIYGIFINPSSIYMVVSSLIPLPMTRSSWSRPMSPLLTAGALFSHNQIYTVIF